VEKASVRSVRLEKKSEVRRRGAVLESWSASPRGGRRRPRNRFLPSPQEKKRPLAVHDFLELPLLILFAAYMSDPTID
jgi:hypothetical protein